jgi:hypothetical protein
MKKLFFAALAVLALSLAACTAKDDETVLTLGVMPSMDYLPLAVALKEGYTDQLGLKLEIKRFYAATERDAARRPARFPAGHVRRAKPARQKTACRRRTLCPAP